VADAASIRGAEQLEAVGRRLKGAAGAPLRRELLKGIRTGAKGTVQAIRDEARSTLPQSGGLAALVAGGQFGVRTRLTGQSAGVRIVGSSRSVRALRQLNAGRLRHPVYGNRNVWVSQGVEPGFFDRPIEKDVPTIRAAVDRAMSDVSRKIEKG
jgi:prophage DNA circulation protein